MKVNRVPGPFLPEKCDAAKERVESVDIWTKEGVFSRMDITFVYLITK